MKMGWKYKKEWKWEELRTQNSIKDKTKRNSKKKPSTKAIEWEMWNTEGIHWYGMIGNDEMKRMEIDWNIEEKLETIE